MRTAFLGTGLMGAHQARRLLKAGHTVCAWNRSIDKARALVADGATVAATPAEAVAQAEVVFVMLENGDVVQQVLFDSGAAQALARTQPGAVVVDTSSIKPAQARQHALQLHALGLQHVDAPVSGGVSAAEAGSLAIMAGGDEAVFDRVQPLLSAMGRATHVGPSGAGQLAKLANQMIVAVNIAAVAEALQMAAAGGADPAKVRDAIRGGFAESRVLELHGQRMVDGDFTLRARSTMQLKDLRNAQEVALDTGFTAPTVNIVTTLFEDLVAREGEIDHSGLWRQIAHINAPATPP
ncbi:NAD(P)-dependent oxidoreductase [Pantoea sp. 18069]|uniref:NAD(P)-dependent oxidoreductase n=1 Tax=Pantoea sp. 18069 TaxID=2681415 RepID=UPI00135C93BB|nr:NAD(P)-dependent oxidoreductase [Pantoea sp. 18069]